jgi:hypothetical protein
VYWKGADPSGRAHSLSSLAAIVVFAWLLGVIGIYDAGAVVYALLAVAVVVVIAADVRRPA